MDPMRGELGIVRLLEAEAYIEWHPGVTTLMRHIWESDDLDIGTLNDVGVESALVQFLADRP